MNKAFFELIQVSIGTRDRLSIVLTKEEWKDLYETAKRHSVLGVCFAGIQRLAASVDEDFAQIGIDEMLYLTWMGMAAKIQQRNERVNRQCVELLARLAAEGISGSILKGQGVGALYGRSLSGLRQTGDIDVWVPDGMQASMKWVRKHYGNVRFDYINAHVPVYEDTEVELHWRAQALSNVFANRRMQRWLERADVKEMVLGGRAQLGMKDKDVMIVTPTIEFNAFYILLHCYHHMFESGLGLRQLMDYYFVLLSLEYECPQNARKLDINALLEEFGMMRFASGVMWIMEEVFGLKRNCMLCKPDEDEGRFLQIEIMKNGNFGHHDKRITKVGSGKISELCNNVQHNWHLVSHYPSEFLWQPIWLGYHFIWKRLILLDRRYD